MIRNVMARALLRAGIRLRGSRNPLVHTAGFVLARWSFRVCLSKVGRSR